MKKLLFLSSIAALTIFIGCKKSKQLTNISEDMPYSADVALPSIPGIDSISPPPGGMDLSAAPIPLTIAEPTYYQQFLTQYGTDSNKVISVTLKQLSLKITTPSSANFDFVDSVEVYLSAHGQPEILAAYRYNVPRGVDSFDLVPNSGVNLKNYFLQDSIYFRLDGHIVSAVKLNETFHIGSVFHLLANPLN